MELHALVWTDLSDQIILITSYFIQSIKLKYPTILYGEMDQRLNLLACHAAVCFSLQQSKQKDGRRLIKGAVQIKT